MQRLCSHETIREAVEKQYLQSRWEEQDVLKEL